MVDELQMRKAEMKTPLVSVVIPAYNRSTFIVETLSNVFQQTYSNYEVVLVDDASTDDIENVVKTNFLKHMNSGKLRYLKNNENMERSFSRNKGVEAANGEIIAFLDSDDIWLPEHIKIGVDQIMKFNCDISCTLPAYTTAGHTVNIEKVITAKARQNIKGLSGVENDELVARGTLTYFTGVLLRKNTFIKSGGFRTELFVAEDWELMMRLFFKYRAKLNVIHKPSYFIRIHSDNTFMSNKYWEHPYNIIRNDELPTYIWKCGFLEEVRKVQLVSNLCATRSKMAFSRAMLFTGWKNIFISVKFMPELLFFRRRDILYFAIKRGFIPKTIARCLKRNKEFFNIYFTFVRNLVASSK